MIVRVVLRQDETGRWEAVSETGARRRGGSVESCLRAIREQVRPTRGQALDVVAEVLPQLVGVAEAAELLDWDRRRVVTYVTRGAFPEPVAWLRGGRVWRRDDVLAFQERFLERRRRRAQTVAPLKAERPAP